MERKVVMESGWVKIHGLKVNGRMAMLKEEESINLKKVYQI